MTSHDRIRLFYFTFKGLTLYNNAQVKVGDDISIDISSLKGFKVNCKLSSDYTWNNSIQICFAKPPDPCNPGNQYQGRSSFFNDTTLQITGVLANESGIYRCSPGRSVPPPVTIYGIIIVGRFLIYFLFKSTVINLLIIEYIAFYIDAVSLIPFNFI